MDESKVPFISEEARNSLDSHYEPQYTSDQKHHQQDLVENYNTTPQPDDQIVSTRTAKAFKIALVLWLGVVFVTYLALSKSGCSMHRAPVKVEEHIPGGGLMAALGGGPENLGYKVVVDLPKDLIPQHKSYWEDGNHRRLIFIGDVHGSFRPLKELLKKLSYDSSKDHIIFLGDMITRGQKSLEVLNLAMSEKASCVRGNHEDRILLLRKQLKKHPKSKDLETTSNQRLKSEIKLARKLNQQQVDWLESCPVILNVNDVPGVGHVAAVHAGLRAGVPLAKQDPVQVMNMRSIDPETGVPTSEKNGKHWAIYWNHAQKATRQPMTVVYGHYASAGLDIRRYSIGLDSDCNRKGKLSALVIDSSKNGGKIVQVDCKKLADKEHD